ncbi:MAG: tRNA pseudouridine(38-40) synthase TruA [Bacteroidia bacterium]|nr:tRNA pseudouridine(38-40) synthase TruA [Bacteroidia bacterium]MCF8427325.1 tRNA pseudouridine(38-40) synthase TruA [Bacteroidia bacterium]MCF8446238.1 tRNA pseudouridine(38-40) synthase TruA [Bacteroidia bacterium]
MRYFIELAYNGKNYHGWQKQPNATSVQETLESKLSILLKEEIDVIGCGRTDTGVHAKNYFLHFETEAIFDTERLNFQLNSILPKDITIFSIFRVEPNFHARFDATEREYEYWISTKPDPFHFELSLLYTKPLDIEAMNETAKLLLSHSDFECFSKVHTDVKTFICNVTYAKWELRENGKLVFTIRADRFLRNMVRAIVGTLLEVGKGKINQEDFKQILQSKNRSEAGMSVAAHGLFLTKISYPDFKK